MEWAVLAAAGLAAGAINAVAGGGGLIIFPTLVALGLPPVAANVTNSVAVFPGYLPAVAAFRGELVGQRHLRALLPTLVVGALAGCALLLLTPARVFALAAPVLVLAAAVVIGFGDRIAAARTAAPHPAAAHVAVGLTAVYGGYFGAAVGLLLIAVLGLTTAATLHRVNAWKAVFQAVIACVTVLVFALFGPVDWRLVAVLAPATVAGGYLGARAARALPVRPLRAVIVAFGTVAAAALLVAELRR
ncbi:MAG TPA: sulfite exporter TauE/SafE family protein [Pilimelia sp.]|nr:sulfite exporter TauE/SafE family protein [Pilimelia sp.]